jgi:mono/diheme cytochrome c family protein
MNAHAAVTGAFVSALLLTGVAMAAPPAPALGPKLNAAGEGRRLWLELNCYSCHGMNAAGGMGPNIQHAEAGDVREAVMQGVPEGGMPSFKKYVKSKDISNLGAYLRSIGTKGEPVWVDWWNANP